METGWNAKGLLRPLWSRLPGKREELARLTGIGGNTLSAYNAGSRQLGITNATRIANALRVSVLELGAPEGEADARGRTVLDRLDELATKLGDTIERQKKTAAEVSRLRARVRVLEAQHGPAAAAATDQ